MAGDPVDNASLHALCWLFETPSATSEPYSTVSLQTLSAHEVGIAYLLYSVPVSDHLPDRFSEPIQNLAITSYDWSAMNVWNAKAVALSKSRDGHRRQLFFETTASQLRSRQATPSKITLSYIGIWAHLLPFEHFYSPVFPRTETALKALLDYQHSDGLAYPVCGGGACPDFNYASLLAYLLHAPGISATLKQRITESLIQMKTSLLSYLEGAAPPWKESFRHQPLNFLQRLFLPRDVAYWVSPSTEQQLKLSTPNWWNTLVRLMTLDILNLALDTPTLISTGLLDSLDHPSYNHLTFVLCQLHRLKSRDHQ